MYVNIAAELKVTIKSLQPISIKHFCNHNSASNSRIRANDASYIDSVSLIWHRVVDNRHGLDEDKRKMR